MTIAYNLIEGLVSTWYGGSEESLALFGFGVDSFIEAASGVGIAHMIVRLRRNPDSPRDAFERTALRVTGVSFHVLAIGLLVTVGVNLFSDHRPGASLPGIIIGVISIGVMLWLLNAKLRVGRALASPAIIADAGCTRICISMSLVLLGASAAYELTGIGHLDSVGAAALGYLSFREGKECFEKARTDNLCPCP